MVQYPSAQGLMAGPLGGWLDGQVAVRADARRKARGRLWLAAAVLVPAAAALLLLTDWDLEAKLGAIVGVCFAAYNWSQRPIDKAKRAIKDGINGAVAEALGLRYEQACDDTAQFAQAETFRLIPHYDRKSFEDHWAGAVDGHAFSLHEAHLEEQRGSGKNRHWVTVFRGSIIRIGFAQSFHGTTLVARNGRFSSLLGDRKDSIEVDGITLDAAVMVHPEFEDAFDVYTSDQTEARWIVHPSYIEKLIAIEHAVHGEKIAALFTGGAVTIVINCGNMFESGSIDPADDHAKLNATIAQLQRLADLALALNTVRH